MIKVKVKTEKEFLKEIELQTLPNISDKIKIDKKLFKIKEIIHSESEIEIIVIDLKKSANDLNEYYRNIEIN
jgi:hypothetical protein